MSPFRAPHTLIGATVLALAAGLAAQESGTVSGLVTDGETGRTLAGVSVMVQSTFIGAASDREGRYRLVGVPPGTYNLVASMIGYRQATVQGVEVQPGEEHILDFGLQQDVLATPQIVVTATRREQNVMEAPISVTVIGLRQILEKGAISLEEVVPFEAGVTAVKGQLNIRGASGYTLGAGSRSLLLLDGVPLLGSAAGNIVWTVIPASEIERVEILKSAGSALYGSSAMGGVLNIITRNGPLAPQTRWRTRLGRYSRPRYRQWRWRDDSGWLHTTEVTHARPFGEHGGWLRLQRNYSPGYNRLNWLDAWNTTGKVKLNFGSRYNAALFANYYSEEKGLESVWKSAADPFQAPVGSENDRGVGQKFNLNGFVNYIYSPAVVLKMKAAWYDVWWRNHGSNRDYSQEDKYYGELLVATDWSPTLNTTTGAVLERATIDARIFGVHASRSLAVYAQVRGRPGRGFLVSAGSRGEIYAVDGHTLNRTVAPSIALSRHRLPWLALRASAGQGFRVPTVAEMYSRAQLNVFRVEPNPELQAETSVSAETGGTLMLATTRLAQLKLDASLFTTSFHNLIEPVPDQSGIIHFENITTARISGQELSLVAALAEERGLLKVAYTHLDPVEVDRKGQVIDTLSYRFRHDLTVTVTAFLAGLAATAEYRYASRMDKTELFAENPLTGQDKRVPIHLWNVGLGYTRRGWEVLLRVENLFQYYYVELERNMGRERLTTLSVSKEF